MPAATRIAARDCYKIATTKLLPPSPNHANNRWTNRREWLHWSG